jgi:hypothetical protein
METLFEIQQPLKNNVRTFEGFEKPYFWQGQVL